MNFKANNWNKLKDNGTPKLLIIGCADFKTPQYNQIEKIHHRFNFGPNIKQARQDRLTQYTEMLANPNPANYFTKKRNGNTVHADYFQNALNEGGNCYKALNLYGGSARSHFYTNKMKALYEDKINNVNFHLLIVSGLYGIIKYDDCIIDYHLEIHKKRNLWGNSILPAVLNYIQQNNIDDDAVFYSLSEKYLSKLQPINTEWTNLWRNYGHAGNYGRRQAEDLEFFLTNF